MKWHKKGIIFSRETLNLPWFKKNVLVPVPCPLDEGRLRLFVTLCDELNIGRIGFVDVEAGNPSQIIGYSRDPVLDIGKPGCFDDRGVVTASALRVGAELRLYYSGYHFPGNGLYQIFSGLAVSGDQGLTAERRAEKPILAPNPREVDSRCAPIVLKDDGKYKMWYTGDYANGWVEDSSGKKMPHYLIKYLESDDGLTWPDEPGQNVFSFRSADEHGLAKPSLWWEGGRLHMIYSIRSLSLGYRLGYAVSNDGGLSFVRRDEEIGLDVSPEGWDSEMICFGSRFAYQDRVYLFYCGNQYGQGGLGYAELKKNG